MKIVGICGSPRKGNTDIMVREALRGARSKGAIAKLISLGNYCINYCDGCLICDKTHECHIKDDMQVLIKKVRDADALIVGTPTRYYSMSGQLKGFIERLNPILLTEDLKGKSIAILGVGETNSKWVNKAIRDLEIAFVEGYGMIMFDKVVGIAKKAGEIKKNKKTLKKCYNLGMKLAKA